MLKIEHIGIAVKSLSESSRVYERLLNTKIYKHEEVVSEKVMVDFFKVGEQKIELLEATSNISSIARFIENRGEGLHHVAFAVNDIYAEMSRLKAEGFTLLSDEPRLGADNKLVCFVHPKDCSGVLIELCQEIS